VKRWLMDDHIGSAQRRNNAAGKTTWHSQSGATNHFIDGWVRKC
jgi:hypothetical protein